MKAREEEIKFDPDVLLERIERFAAEKEPAVERWVKALSADDDQSNRPQMEQMDTDCQSS